MTAIAPPAYETETRDERRRRLVIKDLRCAENCGVTTAAVVCSIALLFIGIPFIVMAINGSATWRLSVILGSVLIFAGAMGSVIFYSALHCYALEKGIGCQCYY